MKHSVSTSLLVMACLTITVFVGYSFMNAAWTEPTGTPPTDNVDAQINVGTITQEKLGTLGVNGLAVFGASTFLGNFTTAKLSVVSNGPALELIDASEGEDLAGEKDWRVAVENGDSLVIRADRNQNSNWTDDGYPHPLFLRSGDNVAGDFAVFSNKVRATEYCDQSRANCVPATNLLGGAYDLNVMQSSVVGWNGRGVWSYPTVSYAPVSTYPVCFLTTSQTTARGDSDLTGAGGCVLTHNGTDWSLTAIADKRADTLCQASCLGS